jgi:hypothetical protein
MQPPAISGDDPLNIAVEKSAALGNAQTSDPLRNPLVPDQAMPAHRNSGVVAKLQQAIGGIESQRFRLRSDAAHLHRDIRGDDSCVLEVKLPVTRIVADRRTGGGPKNKSTFLRNFAKTLVS